MTLDSQRACATAPGKVILLGEHAVVYGRTAIAAAIDRHVTVRIGHAEREDTLREPKPEQREAHSESEMDQQPFMLSLSKPAVAGTNAPCDSRLTEALARAADIVGLRLDGLVAMISTDLPLAMGLGSSAALSVALVRALACVAGQPLSDAAVCAGAFEIEKIFHGFPSGIDNTVATCGGLIAFTRGAPARPLAPRRSLPMVVALGRAPRQTRQTVTALRQKWEASPQTCEPLFDDIAALVGDAERAIVDGDLAGLGAAMDANHVVLQRLGISTAEIDDMVALARTHGALGAKLTGGGGGGAVICLCDDRRAVLLDAFREAGWRAFAADVGATQRGAHAGYRTAYTDQHAGPRA